MPSMEWMWLAALVLFAVLEASTSALVSVWFIGGSLAAMIAALLGAPIWLQLVLFFAVSAALLLLLRPIARKYMKSRTVATNVSSNIGKTAVVTAAIDNLRGVGAVKIGGVEWSARSADDRPIEKDAVVRVTKIEGVKVFVELVKEEANL
ncbi:MAG: NfeD family protein [Oscillospiraceae bacterium]|nr:NfeD family protein [Oscillospiraceae bacterium]